MDKARKEENNEIIKKTNHWFRDSRTYDQCVYGNCTC